jgi:small GTP-binding protein
MIKLTKKVCLLGDFAVGKTSLVRRFVHNVFEDKYISTIGVKVSYKTLAIPQNDGLVDLTLVLWDMAGSEEFRTLRTSYLRGAAGAMLVCDLTRPETLKTITSYATDMRSMNPGAKITVAANKLDLIPQQVPGAFAHLTQQDVEAVAAGIDAPCYLTSAKTGDEVEAIFRHLGQLLTSA